MSKHVTNKKGSSRKRPARSYQKLKGRHFNPIGGYSKNKTASRAPGVCKKLRLLKNAATETVNQDNAPVKKQRSFFHKSRYFMDTIKQKIGLPHRKAA